MSESRAALLVGAGDAIGAAVARRFAAGGYRVCIARRDAAKAQQLVDEMTTAGRYVRAYSVDAREQDQVQNLCEQVEREVDRSKFVSSTPAQTFRSRCSRQQANCSSKHGSWPATRAFWSAARRRDACFIMGAARCCLPEPPPVFAAERGLPPSPRPSSGCAQSLNRWRANWARRTSTLFILFSTVR
jgi:NAD(P)-dependent dehydrogenase (short-subunit alcohol dehydrogenase family)